MRTLLIILLAGLLTACTMQPLQRYAKAGDAVVVPLGGLYEHAQGKMLKAEDFTAQITDSAGQTFNVAIGHVMRAYSDRATFYTVNGLEPSGTTKRYPYEGQLFLPIRLVDPITFEPLSLAEGSAVLTVASSKLNLSIDESNKLASLNIEILPGVGDVLQGHSEGILAMQPAPQIEVRPGGNTEEQSLAGAELVLRYQTASFDSVPLYILKRSIDPNVQMLSHRMVDGDTTLVKVVLMNPNGFSNHPVLEAGESYLHDLNMVLFWASHNTVNDSNWQQAVQLVPEASFYFDMDGHPIPGVTPVMEKVY